MLHAACCMSYVATSNIEIHVSSFRVSTSRRTSQITKGVDSMDAYTIHFFHLELKVIHASITQNKRGSTCADASEAKYGFSQKLADKS